AARRLEKGGIARAARAETEVRSDHDPARAVVLAQAHAEGIRREGGERRVEAFQESGADAVARDLREPFGEGGESRRGGFRRKELARQRLEREDGGVQVAGPGLTGDAR